MIFNDRRFVILVLLGVFISGTAIASRKFSQPSLGGEMSANSLLETAGRRERTRNQPPVTSVSVPQTPADPVKSARREFTIYRNDEREIVCREATPDEIRARQNEDLNQLGLRQINHLNLDKSVSAQAPAATNLIIVLRATQQLQQNATAVAAFNRAAQNWEDIIMSPITIYIDVDFGTTNFGDPWPANVLGATGAPSSGFPYQSVRTNLNAEATGEGNATKQAIFNALPANSVPTDLGDATAVDVYDSIARAIGLLPATAQPADSAAQIAFNSQNTFDFDPSNGITANAIDFDAVVTHELGHALGFDSDAGENIARPTIWDLYRFHSGTTSAAFPTAQRIMTTGTSNSDLQFDFIPGNPELGLSTGGPDGNGGDMWQSSHWKHVGTCTGYIGIMDPAIANGCRRTITNNDMLALGSFGYNLTNNNQPPPPPPTPTPPPNDNFANAQIISGCNGNVNGSTFGATRETGEPSHDPPDATSLSPNHTVWYQWQAPSSGSATITTAGSDFDTILAVYTGSTLNALSRQAFNDDVQNGVIRTSTVTFPANGGTVYSIAIDGWGGEAGTVKLNWGCGGTPPPSPTPTQSPTDLSITTNSAKDQLAPGASLTYLITVTNNSGPVATSVTVTDNLPAEVTFVSCSSSGTCGGSGNNRSINFASVASGASVTSVITASVSASVANATVVSNTATVSALTPDANPGNNSSTATITVSTNPPARWANGRIGFGSDRSFTGSTQPTGFYTINSDGTGDKVLVQKDPFATALAWSPDGTKVAYGLRAANGTFGDEIYIANADGTSPIKVASNVFASNHRVAWSPSGARLAFIGTGQAIYLVNSNGTGLSQLPNTPTNLNDLAWSPNGSRLAYSNGADVFVMNIDGSAPTNLTQGRPSIHGEKPVNILPHWSPDGTKILFSAQSNNYKDVYVMNADGSGLGALTTADQDTQAAWSPDGTKITFISFNALYVANADGTGKTAVTNNGFYNFHPDWQPVRSIIDLPDFFVKQQYLDFLNRQPDQSGLDFWTNQITSCGSDAQCVEARRVNTSGAFFLSIEFQQTGNLVYRMYKAGFGNLPGKPVAVDRAPFMTDTRQIQSTPGQVIVNQGNWQAQLETNKQAFALAFVQRPAFQTAHASQPAANYVSSLFTNAGVSPTTAETNAATTAFGSGGDAGRAAALRSVAESASVAAKLNNEAFVLMQYFGYLQRNPYDPPESTLDYSGYNFWLGKLNQFNGDFIAAEMVKAFITSSEYRKRFGP